MSAFAGSSRKATAMSDGGRVATLKGRAGMMIAVYEKKSGRPDEGKRKHYTFFLSKQLIRNHANGEEGNSDAKIGGLRLKERDIPVVVKLLILAHEGFGIRRELMQG